jgi:hypothetical protein
VLAKEVEVAVLVGLNAGGDGDEVVFDPEGSMAFVVGWEGHKLKDAVRVMERADGEGVTVLRFQ